MTAPTFSVVTPSFNQAAYIEGCIESVLAQGVTDFEHIIFDAGSTDGTLDILRKYPHLRWTSEPDRGQAHALNKGFSAARGRILCWLNTDDRYALDAFEIARRELLERDRAVIFGNAREIFFDGRPERIQRPRFERREDLLRWWDKSVSLLQPAIFFTREAWEKAGPLREDLHIVMDLEFWWRLSAVAPFHYVDEVLAVQLRQPDSKTMRLVYRMYREKQAVFAALRHEIEGRRLRTLLAARAGLGWRFLQLAQSAAATERRTARFFLGQSLRENPLGLVRPRWWMTLVRTLRGRGRRGGAGMGAVKPEAEPHA
jgi:glycosyltransferase involved in cell wall biosynthesis